MKSSVVEGGIMGSDEPVMSMVLPIRDSMKSILVLDDCMGEVAEDHCHV
jgi:hypothetical protein